MQQSDLNYAPKFMSHIEQSQQSKSEDINATERIFASNSGVMEGYRPNVLNQNFPIL